VELLELLVLVQQVRTEIAALVSISISHYSCIQLK